MPIIPPTPANTNASIDVGLVRKLFAHPESVAASNFMRREVAGRMHERLALIKVNPIRILEAGCGEGADISLLNERFPDAHLLAVDASLNMLRAGRYQQNVSSTSFKRLLNKILPHKKEGRFDADLINGNFAQLPFENNALDVVWSNLALHWHPQPDNVLAEWKRILRMDGLLMFSCFGPDTFKELRRAFTLIDHPVNVLPFIDMHDYGDMLGWAGFAAPVMDMEMMTVTYDSVARMLEDVRAFGGNPLWTRGPGLMGKEKWRVVVGELEKMRLENGKIPLTFEVLYGHAFRPALKHTLKGEAIIQMQLSTRKR